MFLPSSLPFLIKQPVFGCRRSAWWAWLVQSLSRDCASKHSCLKVPHVWRAWSGEEKCCLVLIFLGWVGFCAHTREEHSTREQDQQLISLNTPLHFSYMYVCTTCVRCPWSPEEGVRSPYSCKPPCWCWESNMKPLEEQPVLLAAQPFLQPNLKVLLPASGSFRKTNCLQIGVPLDFISSIAIYSV